ncbi:hypothetical protein C8Q75DRAFT_803496 [Abortiporus biennis]|nr:hypothetical protein C8Q75DRAFT_803496 [Abortiporus biennis]
MASTRPILDSSPIEIPKRKSSVTSHSRIQSKPSHHSTSSSLSESQSKLSSSARHKPSIQALPTPPRTKHSRKRKRRARRATDSESESDDNQHDSDSDIGCGKNKDSIVVGHKKRKVLQLDTIAAELSGRQEKEKAEEDEFWTGESSFVKKDNEKGKEGSDGGETERGRTLSRSPTPTRSPSASPAPHLLKRTNTGLFSPPPSRRHPRPRTPPPTTLKLPPLPRTPPPRRKRTGSITRRLFPERDSPNNPFLVSADDVEGETSPEPVPRSDTPTFRTPPPQKYVEKPTITYVFRGVKGEFENPLYDPEFPDGVPPIRPGSPSQLDPSDPDFSPTPYCPPKLLFPEARKRNHARFDRRSESPTPVPGSSRNRLNGNGKGKAKVVPVKVRSEWDSSDDEDYGEKGKGKEKGKGREMEEREDALKRLGAATTVKAKPRSVHEDDEAEQEQEDSVGAPAIGERPKKAVPALSVEKKSSTGTK